MRSIRPTIAALRLRTVLPAVAVAGVTCLAAAACGSSSAPTAGGAYGGSSSAPPASAAAPASGKAMLIVSKANIGYVLATSTGKTIYWYSKDHKGGTTSACTGSCASAWPAVTGIPVAASGVQLAGKLGSITLPGGGMQATYNGYPLYTYAGDTSPGQATGNGQAGVWHVISGAVLSPSPASAAAASLKDVSKSGASAPAGGSSSPASGGGGYGGGGY